MFGEIRRAGWGGREQKLTRENLCDEAGCSGRSGGRVGEVGYVREIAPCSGSSGRSGGRTGEVHE